MATNLRHIVIRYRMAYAAELTIAQSPCQSRIQAYLLREPHPSHETTHKTKGTISTLLCFFETSLFINIKDKGLYWYVDSWDQSGIVKENTVNFGWTNRSDSLTAWIQCSTKKRDLTKSSDGRISGRQLPLRQALYWNYILESWIKLGWSHEEAKLYERTKPCYRQISYPTQSTAPYYP
jgi:hypothetical protein